MGFTQVFKTPPAIQASAPGRVNLLGEHTDYNDGFVLPTAIPQQTTVALGLGNGDRHHFYSQTLAEHAQFKTTDPAPAGFASYVFGCIRVLEYLGINVPPLHGWIASSVPIGAGLSSSAALEVALLRGVRSLLQLDLSDVDIARLGQQAEREYAGVQCGILDQMAVSFADTQHWLFLDTRTLEFQLIPIPADVEILVMDSGIPRTLATSGYNQRRAECEAAAAQLGVQTLRDVEDLAAIAHLPDPLNRRARHVMTENKRVLEASQGVSARRLGELMNASHASLRDDYQVSIPEMDRLVTILQAQPGVLGAKLTGAGFGGACVVLVEAGKREAIAQRTLEDYNQSGLTGRVLVP